MLTTRLFIGLIVFALAAVPASAAPGALERLTEAIHGAWEQSPRLAMHRIDLETKAADFRSVAAAGFSSVEWEREGIGPSFSRRENAQTSLRLATPFIPPWEWKERDDLLEGTDLFTDAQIGAMCHETAARVAREWLKLAATLDALEVARGRRDRLTRAVALQTHRRDLGEVAGLDVIQLDLERLRDANRVHQLETAVAERRARLTELAGTGVPLPIPGDLEALVQIPSTMPSQHDLDAALSAGPPGRAVLAEAEVQGARAAVIAKAAWGRPEAGIEWEHIPNQAGVPGFDAMGLRVSWPLPFGRAGRATAAGARAEAAAADAGARADLRELERRFRAAAAAAAGAAGVLEESKPAVEKLARAEHSLAEQFRLGAISYIVYIDGLSRLDDVRTEMIRARLDLLEARVEIATVLGGTDVFPLPENTP